MTPGGSILFTAPLEVGGWVDLHTGHECRSLGRARYEHALKQSGLRLIATHEDEGANNCYEARCHRSILRQLLLDRGAKMV
jgi:hypothetical protein